MAEIMLSIGGHSYQVACRDGEEPHLRTIADSVDRKVKEARSAVGDLSEVRQLLLASLLLADELLETARPAPALQLSGNEAETVAIERLADHVEAIAARLEKAH
jgi:cell division protein ZapA